MLDDYAAFLVGDPTCEQRLLRSHSALLSVAQPCWRTCHSVVRRIIVIVSCMMVVWQDVQSIVISLGFAVVEVTDVSIIGEVGMCRCFP